MPHTVIMISFLTSALLIVVSNAQNPKHNGCVHVPTPMVQCNTADPDDGQNACAAYCGGYYNPSKLGECVDFSDMFELCGVQGDPEPPLNKACICYDS
ncbi:hypothetical protein AAVH_20717 [Aphelenchoides avenae]|nr:hypothetical protein AAVH_20717 [Aphelenchus avenae]